MKLSHSRIHCDTINFKVNLKKRSFHPFKVSEMHYFRNAICWIGEQTAITYRHKTHTPSYPIVTRNGFIFLFQSFENKVLQKSVFQDCSKTKQIAGICDYAKNCYGKYQRIRKIMKMTKSHCRIPVFDDFGGQLHKARMKLE